MFPDKMNLQMDFPTTQTSENHFSRHNVDLSLYKFTPRRMKNLSMIPIRNLLLRSKHISNVYLIF